MSSWAVDCFDVPTRVHNGEMNNDRGTNKPSMNTYRPTARIDQVSSDDSGSTINRLVYSVITYSEFLLLNSF